MAKLMRYQYIVNIDYKHNKDYLVLFDADENTYWSVWGKIGSAQGTRTFKNEAHVINTIRKKIAEGGYKVMSTNGLQEPYNRSVIQKESFLQGKISRGEGPTFTKTTGKMTQKKFLTPAVYAAQEEENREEEVTVISDKKANTLMKKLREYLEVNTKYDHKLERVAKEIGQAVSLEIAKELIKEHQDVLHPLLDYGMMKKIFKIMFKVKYGSSPIQNVLLTLTSEKIATLNASEQSFLRSCWKKPGFSLAQYLWLSKIFKTLFTTGQIPTNVLNPFDDIEIKGEANVSTDSIAY